MPRKSPKPKGRVVAEMVHIDDLYPKGPEDYDPDCCCAMCLDMSIAIGRRNEAAAYRKMRREGKGKIARMIWKAQKRVQAAVVEQVAHALFYAEPDSKQPKIGLAALIAD